MDDRTNSCSICLDHLATDPIGATTPCGHCFHVHCFENWKQSSLGSARAGGNVKCPLCNNRTAEFHRLFLDLTGATLQGEGGGDDDDDDLSTDCEEEEEDAVVNEERNDNSTAGDTSSGSTPRPKSDCEDGVPFAREETSPSSSSSSASSDARRTDNNVGNFVDLSSDVEVVETRSSRRETTATTTTSAPHARGAGEARTSTPSTSSEEKKGRDYRKLAKRFKRRVKTLEAQRKQQIGSYRELLNKHETSEERLRLLDEELGSTEEELQSLNVKLDGASLARTRLMKECTTLQQDLDKAVMQRDAAAKELEDIKSYYKKEMAKMQSSQLREVQGMIAKYPKLVDENQRLKENVTKLREQSRKLFRLVKAESNRPSSSTTNSSAERKGEGVRTGNEEVPREDRRKLGSRSAFDVARQLDAANRTHETKKRKLVDHRFKLEEPKNNTMKHKLSMQAARMSRAGEKGKARPSAGLAALYDMDNHDSSDPQYCRSGAPVALQLPSRNGSRRLEEISSNRGPPSKKSAPQLHRQNTLDSFLR